MLHEHRAVQVGVAHPQGLVEQLARHDQGHHMRGARKGAQGAAQVQDSDVAGAHLKIRVPVALADKAAGAVPLHQVVVQAVLRGPGLAARKPLGAKAQVAQQQLPA